MEETEQELEDLLHDLNLPVERIYLERGEQQAPAGPRRTSSSRSQMSCTTASGWPVVMVLCLAPMPGSPVSLVLCLKNHPNSSRPARPSHPNPPPGVPG